MLQSLVAATAAPTEAAAPARQAAIGMYVTAMHEIDLDRNSFVADFYIWADSPADAPDPLAAVQVARARTQTSLYQHTETVGNRRWSLRKYRCDVLNDWVLTDFPFDSHVLAIAVELNPDQPNPEHHVADEKNSGMGSRVALSGWRLSHFNIFTHQIVYASSFGDPKSPDPEKYESVVATFELERESWRLFIKLMGGAYLATCAALLGCFMKTDQPTIFSGRIGLQVGCLFSTVINHRAAGNVVGRSDVFTLPDGLHLLCYLLILASLIITLRSRRLNESGESGRERVAIAWENRVTRWAALVFLALNVMLILAAVAVPPHAEMLRTIEVGD